MRANVSVVIGEKWALTHAAKSESSSIVWTSNTAYGIQHRIRPDKCIDPLGPADTAAVAITPSNTSSIPHQCCGGSAGPLTQFWRSGTELRTRSFSLAGPGGGHVRHAGRDPDAARAHFCQPRTRNPAAKPE